jgi:hypothetical protein
VTRICRALNTNQHNLDSPVGTRSGPGGSKTQTIFYHRGIGTNDGLESKWMGGGTGSEISEHVRECYGFLCNNYQAGDELFLFGFSRGWCFLSNANPPNFFSLLIQASLTREEEGWGLKMGR